MAGKNTPLGTNLDPPVVPRWVLVVDDDAVLRASLAALLGCQDFSVTEAADARQAEAILHASPDKFAAVLIDHFMPECTGIELYRILRGKYPLLPILLLSGYAAEDVLASQQGQVDVRLACLEKPVSLQQLTTTLERLMSVQT